MKLIVSGGLYSPDKPSGIDRAAGGRVRKSTNPDVKVSHSEFPFESEVQGLKSKVSN